MHAAAKQFADAITDLSTIDRHITTVQEDRATHQTRCLGRCWRYRSDSTALERLIDQRLRFMGYRDAAEAQISHLLLDR